MSSSSLVERLKLRGRRLAGAIVHAAGGYRWLLPVFEPSPTGVRRRLQTYLNLYYSGKETVEVALKVPELDVTFRCDLRDHMLEPWVKGWAPVYELAEIEYVRALAGPGDRIVDLGANHGFWGFSVARAAGQGARLVLVEANPTVVRRLRRTCVLNPGIDATVVECALGDGAVSEIPFFLPRTGLSGLGSIVLHDHAREHGFLEAGRRMVVKARTLDSLVAEGVIDGMDLVKIDLEQAEDLFLEGARKAFCRFRPRFVMCETSSESKTFEFFRDLGYRPYMLDPRGERGALPEERFWGNIFFGRDGETEALPS